MSTNDVLITPGSGEVKWVDSGGSDFVRIIGDAGATNTITFVGDDNTANGVIFQDHATDVFYPATSGLNLGVSANRWNLFATAGDFSGAITTATNITLSGASSLLAINGASATISMGGTAGLFTFSGGSSILLSGANSSVTLTGLSSVLTLAGVTGTNLAPLKFTTGSAPGTSVAGQMWWTGSSNLQFAKTNGTASTFAFTDTDLSTFTVGILGVARGGTGTGTTFTLGSVVFAGASGVYTQDNANFFWDDTNNRLGIGTASPTFDLSLGGEAARTVGVNRRGTGAGNNFTVQSGGAQLVGTNLAAGTLILSSGTATGNATGYVDIYAVNNDGLIGGTSDNPAVLHARIGSGKFGFGTSTLTYDITLASMVNVSPYTYVVGMLDSTTTSGYSLKIQAGHAITAADLSGGSVLITAGNATGTGSSSIVFQTATAGGSGTTVRTSSTKVTIDGTAMSLSPHGTSAGNTYEFQFLELAANGTNYLSFKAPDSIGTTITHTLPSDVPAAGEALKVTSYSGGVAVLEWGSVASSLSIGSAITSSTTGSVLFVGASSDLQQDNANFFWDDTNNTLGVGTTRTGAISGTNPRLRVKGSGATSATSSFEAQDSAAASLFLIRDDGLINFGTKGTYTESTGRVALTVTGNTGGLLIGGDALLYRSAADTLRTPDSVIIDTTLQALRAGFGAAASATSAILVNQNFNTFAASSTVFSIDITTNGTVATGGNGYLRTLNFTVQGNGGETFTEITGFNSASYSNATATVSNLVGYTNQCVVSNTGLVTSMFGYRSYFSFTSGSGGGATNARHFEVRAPNFGTAGNIAAHSGLYINNLGHATRITNAYGVYIAGQTASATASYGIYFAGTSAAARDGITWNADTNLYRSAADTLKTDDSLVIATNLTVNSLTTTRVPFASTSGLLIDSANFTYTTGTGQLALATTGSGAGILLGGDVNLYRSAADTLKTDDSLVVARALNTGVSTLSDGATPALDASLGNTFLLTAAGDRTIAVPTNAVSGQKITIVHKASGGARTLSLNTGAGGFRFGTDITALTSTTSGLTDYIGAIYNSADSKWDIVSYVKGFA